MVRNYVVSLLTTLAKAIYIDKYIDNDTRNRLYLGETTIGRIHEEIKGIKPSKNNKK